MEAPFFEGRAACCFTGHRPFGLPGRGDPADPAMAALLTRLSACVQAAAAAGVGTFLAGGASGFDTAAEEAVISARADFPALRLVLALPSRTFLSTRGGLERVRLARAMDASDEIVYMSEDDNAAAAFKARDRYMVEHADCCVAYLNRNTGGTCYTVHYAQRRGLPIYNLAQDSQC